MQEIKEKLESLRQQIRRHEYLYYVESNPEISDKEFDILLKQLEELEKQYPELVTPDSPTQRVGGSVTSFDSIRHRVPMMSIENSYSLPDIMEWLDRCEKLLNRSPFPVVAELKIDGISGSFNYNEGILINGATRGNGIEGDLVTNNIKTVKSLPLNISSKLDIDVRGEIYTPRSVLKELNDARIAEGLEPFKNCRNLTSGTVKSLDPNVAAQRKLGVMVYGIAQAKELGFKKHSEALIFLKQQGFKLNQEIQICNNVEDVQNFISRVDALRKDLNFDIDGVVLKIDDLDKQEELGTTAKAPRWVIAYKYPQERARSRLLNVEWQVGRSKLTPVACLEPVELCGTTVSRASLHNIDQIREKDIRLGDLVLVEKAAYIIPYVVGPVKEERTGQEQEIQVPEFCPACGGKVTVTKDEDDASTIARCDNELCLGVKARRTTHFITQLEIENFGPQLVDRLLEQKLISQPEDILRLTEEQLASVDRMGLKSASKIVTSINKASSKPLYRLISALGIANVGIVVSESIAKAVHQSLEEFLAVTPEKLQNIEGIQDKIAQGIISFISSPNNQNFISAVKNWWHGPSAEELEASKASNKLEGKSFVVTGEASVPRRKLEDLIKSSGGQTKSSVSVKTDYLVIGSLEGEDFSSTKKTKAIQLSKPIINEFELCEMVGVSIESLK